MGVESTPPEWVHVDWAEIIAWLVNMGAVSVLLWRLQTQGLGKTYRYFRLYLSADLIKSAGLFALYIAGGAVQTTAYGVAYVATIPPMGVLKILVVLELYSLVLKNHPGIQTLGGWALKAGVVAAIVIASITLYPDFSGLEPTYMALFYAAVFERAVGSALLIFLAVITGFLVWFPVPLSRNTILHALAFGVYFSSSAILFLIRNMIGTDVVRVLSTANMVITNLCLLAWIVFLTAQGEQRAVVFGHRWRPEQSEELVKQLDALNSSLLRVGRK